MHVWAILGIMHTDMHACCALFACQGKLQLNISIRAMVDKAMKALEEEHGDIEEAGISIP